MKRTSPLALLALTGLLLTACGGSETPQSGDTTKPTVTLTASPSNVQPGGTVTLTATASDNVGVFKVSFYRGTTLVNEDTTAPYTVTDTVPGTASSTLTYRAVASDAAGNSAEATATVKVDIDPNEPNDSVAASTLLNIGTPINGFIGGQDRDMDYFKFTATAGDMLKLTVKSTSIDPKSTLDPYVEILLADGKTVLEKDDDGGADLESEIRFNVPTTGTYYVALTSFDIHDDPKAKDDKPTNTYQIALTRR
ncbi:Ig-like domain-containing protein [Deinococcus sp. AJ005]|uniref:Ig-like domain-containing protein n=1 Tax=Deinococcus sp. AJ005 TaxID=2652443 RepID=UPI00125CC9FB|nr:Ig-like domain-containing protein [Deinococcus sp. AJ005]QFP76000.1 peptidase-like protein [Deinococcus sp. AJ005]